MSKAKDQAATRTGRSGAGDEDNKDDRDAADAQIRFKSEEIISKDDQIEATKGEMDEVRQENQRLKMHLERLTTSYHSLWKKFQDIRQQEATRKANYNNASTANIASTSLSSQPDLEEHDVSLSLGRTSSSNLKKEVTVKSGSEDNHENVSDHGRMSEQGLLALGLENKQFEASKMDHTSSTEPLTNNTSADNSLDEEKKEDVMGETWPPPKTLKRSGEDEIDSHHNNGKRARVSVRARCDTPTMNDGCQWRKYGQKVAKGNPCPRAYYRCTVASSCPVRKQVQRSADDMSILITTYEGTHNHPLPAAATAMASTTSAAASMLISGSSSTSSRPVGLGQSSTSTPATTTSVGLHGLTYNLANGMTSSQPRPHQFYIHNNSQISPSPNTHPTITLDLTASNPFTSPFANPHFNRFTSSSSYDPYRLFPLKSTSLNFASMDSNPTPTSMSWASNHGSVLSYGNQYPQSNNRNNHNLGSLTLASRQPHESIYRSFMQKTSAALHQQQQQQQQHLLPDTIAAATKAITADPSFQTTLAAALTSIIGGGASGGGNNNEKVQVSSMENLGQKMKWGDQVSTQRGSGCASSFLNTSSASNAQSSGMMFLQPSSAATAASKSKSTSPNENNNHQDHNMN